MSRLGVDALLGKCTGNKEIGLYGVVLSDISKNDIIYYSGKNHISLREIFGPPVHRHSSINHWYRAPDSWYVNNQLFQEIERIKKDAH